ncbi:MAG: hypothetical protein LBD03_09845 [Methanobrevibacter sp.]|nr:hypothetical protein [Candidatus Methanovirga procula]
MSNGNNELENSSVELDENNELIDPNNDLVPYTKLNGESLKDYSYFLGFLALGLGRTMKEYSIMLNNKDYSFAIPKEFPEYPKNNSGTGNDNRKVFVEDFRRTLEAHEGKDSYGYLRKLSSKYNWSVRANNYDIYCSRKRMIMNEFYLTAMSDRIRDNCVECLEILDNIKWTARSDSTSSNSDANNKSSVMINNVLNGYQKIVNIQEKLNTMHKDNNHAYLEEESLELKLKHEKKIIKDF